MVKAPVGQLSLDFEPGLSRKYRSLRRCVAETVYKAGLDRCAIAADESPGNFSKSLSDREKSDTTSRRFDIDALEAVLEETGDYTPIYYLIDRFLHDEDVKRKQAIQALGSAMPEIMRLLKQAGGDVMTTQPSLQFGDQLDNLIREHADTFRPGFALWLRDNRHVWRAFEREANRAWARGRRHYSARTIIEFLRHETALADNGADFKINGNNVPDMARLYRLRHPERAGLFETRRLAGSEGGVSVRLMAEVFARYPNGGGEMLLALAIADHAHDDGTNVRPSVKSLAEKTRQSERTVQYQLRKMENEGWLDLVGNAGGGRNTPREYRINPEWVKGANSAPLQKGATDDTKGCNPRHERVQSTTQRVQPDVLKGATAIAPEPSEPSRTVRATKRKSAPATAVARPDEVQEQVWSDWLTLRKAKRAPVTETVVKQAAAEAAKAGLPLNRFLEIWCARGSQGLQAEWLKPNELDALRGAEPTRPIGKQMQGVMALEEMIRERKHRVAGDGDPARPAAPRLLVSGSDAGR